MNCPSELKFKPNRAMISMFKDHSQTNGVLWLSETLQENWYEKWSEDLLHVNQDMQGRNQVQYSSG